MAVGLAVAAGKGRAGADAKAGLDDKDGAVRHRRQRGKLLPNPSGAQRAAPQAEGDVRPAGPRDFFKLLKRQVCAGQQVEPAQHGGPVGAAAPQSRHHRDALDKLDGEVVPLHRTAALPEEGAGAADGDVVLSAGEIFAGEIFAGEIFAGERDSVIRLKTAAHLNLAAARLQLEGNGVAQADRLHHHVHLVVAVWQLPHNVQREVDLAGGVDLDAVHQIPPFKPGRGCGWPSPGTSRGSSSSGCSACSGCGPCPARCG